MTTKMQDITEALSKYDAMLVVRGILVRVLRPDLQQEAKGELFTPRRPGAFQRFWAWLFGAREKNIGREDLVASVKGCVDADAHGLIDDLSMAELAVIISQVEGANRGFFATISAIESDRMASAIAKREKVDHGFRAAAEELGATRRPTNRPARAGSDRLKMDGFTPITAGKLPNAMPGIGGQPWGPQADESADDDRTEEANG